MAAITETVVIDAPIEAAYGAFADLDRWPAILPDTLDVQVLYCDGYNQEFTMTVERPGGQETVRGVRYCRAPYELELVQTTPPPLLKRMTGRWNFVEQDGRTTVTATREFELLAPPAGDPAAAPVPDEAEFGRRLSGHLQHNLQLFREAVEADVAR
ncbi:SRPBCC family protein [Kitasatospora sp. NPDC004669]|uniref:SRPBCC family protein n=1 Tax=unclassified Kitasatospora TaxID=2633591 RepID=UPI0033A5D90F